MSPPEDPVNGGIMGLDMGDPALGIPMATAAWDAHTDLMSYCNHLYDWISNHTYKAMYDYMRLIYSASSSRAAAIEQAGDFLGVYGTIVGSGSGAIVHRILRVQSVANIPPRVPGPYSIQLHNAQGTLLAAYPFTPDEHADTPAAQPAPHQPSPGFGQVVPFVAGTTTVRIVRVAGNVVLKSIPVSANAPVMSGVALQNPASPVTGSVTLKWAAGDADGNPLTYDLLYSHDAGKTFQPLKADLAGTSTPVDTDALGGGAVIFRVIAHDGVQTAKANSPAYTLAAKPPEVRILTASGHVKLLYGQNINLIGQARDLQDGYVADSGLVWTNQTGTVLGRGTTLALKQVPAGSTRITLTATNSAGRSASAAVVLDVDDRVEPSGPTLAVTPNQVRWVVKPGSGAQQAQLTLTNAGTGSLSWVASTAADWLTVAGASGTAPSTITLSGDPAGLAEGESVHTTLYVRTADGQQSIAIPVSLQIEGPQVDGPPQPIEPLPFVVGTGTPASCTAAALEAILNAARLAGRARVTFACGDEPHTIELARTLPILSDTIIDGANRITLSGGDLVRHFEVCLPNSNGTADVELELAGLTLIDGKSEPNRAGGSITNYGCRVTVSHSRFIGNTAVHEAGAINSLYDGEVSIVDSSFIGNRAATLGGAIVSHGGRIGLRNSIFRNNAAQAGNGGAIFAYDPAPVAIAGSTFSGNRASSRGGAISAGGATTIGNSTFWRNTAVLGGGAVRQHTEGSMIELTNVTIAGAEGASLSGNLTLRNSLIANTAGAPNCAGTITTGGPNLEYPGTNCGASIQGSDPLLESLGSQGGPTPTVAFESASPARDAGDNAICAAAPVDGIDQRGRPRPLPVGGRCDLGAYELDPAQPITE